MTYPFVFYTNFGVPKTSAGVTYLIFIFIRPEKKDDVGLLKHELVHVKQLLLTLGLHPFLCLLFPKYKLWAEVQAYKAQMSCYPDDRSWLFAGYISTKYGLDITQEEAQKLLKD